ncbi:MAG: hemolysin family protein, partial [Mycobacteriales bacterium]
MSTLWNCLLVLALIVTEGAFVAAELALVSLREGQVRVLAATGSRRGAAVARLASDPNRWLAGAQIGVTLTALLSSAVGAVTLSEQAAGSIADAGVDRSLARALAVVGVTLVISFVTLVIGELAPKRIAIQRSESVATALAPTLDRFAALARPVIWALSRASDLVVRVLGGDPGASRDPITEEELRGIVATHESLTADERKLIDEVFSAGDRQVREVMVPRTEV